MARRFSAEDLIGVPDRDRTDIVDQAGVIGETNGACGVRLRAGARPCLPQSTGYNMNGMNGL
jgi:hypothetical protein